MGGDIIDYVAGVELEVSVEADGIDSQNGVGGLFDVDSELAEVEVVHFVLWDLGVVVFWFVFVGLVIEVGGPGGEVDADICSLEVLVEDEEVTGLVFLELPSVVLDVLLEKG